MLTKVRKRDGRIVDFDQERITNAIWKAVRAVGGKDRNLAKRISDKVVKKLEEKFRKGTPGIEDIQNTVEETLIKEGHDRVAKAYIIYRKQHEELRRVKSTFFEVEKIVDDYMDQMDWRVRENSNVGFSFGGLLIHAAGSIIANYTLDKIYPIEVSDAHRSGDFHLHDLYFGTVAYCAGWSLKQLLLEGFGGISGKLQSSAPKHLDTALLQMANFLGTLQNEWAGAQAFNSIDTYLAPFIREDRLDYNKVKQAIQTFVFNLNITSRWGSQSPFTNVTLDWTVPDDLRNQYVIIGGEQRDRTYEDYQEEMDMLNKAFIEVMTHGDASGRPFTFPIPTYNITKDFPWDNGNTKLLFKMTAKYGLPYFSNFVNSDLNPSDIRSMCCRLRLDIRELKRNVTGGLFGSGDSTGSLGVVTINMPRIGYLSKNEDEFFERLEHLMELAKNSLEIKRKIVTKNMEGGLLPFTKRYLGTLNNHFSTIGLVGMNEACLNLFGEDISSKQGMQFSIKTLMFMRKKLEEFQEETGNLYNLEATPAEGTSYRLAKIDKKKHPKIITTGKKIPYYTNSTHLPVNKTTDVFKAIRHQEMLQTLYTGGTVLHIFFGEMISNGEVCQDFVKKAIGKTTLPYITVTPTYSICQNHGYIIGKKPKCPRCNSTTEVYSRVVGYFRPVSNWNDGKKEEFRQRIGYNKKIAFNGIRIRAR